MSQETTNDTDSMRIRGAWVLMPHKVDGDAMIYHREGFGIKERMPLTEWRDLSVYAP